MPKFTADTRELRRRQGRLIADMRRAAVKASDYATARSREVFASRISGRPDVAPRASRPSVGLGSAIKYYTSFQDDGKRVVVRVNREELDQRTATNYGNPYWLLQEVGTGRSGAIVDPETRTPQPFTTASQVGRPIPVGVAWTHGGEYVRPSTTDFRKHQIGPVLGRANLESLEGAGPTSFAAVSGWGTEGFSNWPIIIGREIFPKRFVSIASLNAHAHFYADMNAAIRRFRQ